MKYTTTLLLLFLYISVYAQPSYSVATIPHELTANANSILVRETMEVDVSKSNKLIYKEHTVRAVLNKKGDNDVISYVAYDDDTHVVSAEVFVYDQKGNELRHFKKRDFNDVSKGDGISLYNDDRALYLDYTPSEYPYIFEFKYEIESKTTAFIPKWYPVGNYWRSTIESTYKLTFDPANKPRFSAANLDGYDISISETPTAIIGTAKNIKAIRYEDASLPFPLIAPNVRFALNKFFYKGVPVIANNWKELGFWMQSSILHDVNDLPEGTVERIKNLVQNDTTHLAKAKKIYEFVQNKVRYISVQIGVGGWKPMLASEVDKLSYGDCKALTNYTKSLLEAVGIPSYYTILYAGSNGLDFSNDFSLLQGNHAILGIPVDNDIVWLECTSQDAPFGFGGSFSDDRDVLIITPEGGKIVRTKTYSHKDNTQENTGSIFIDAQGVLRANVNVVSKGLQYDDKYMWATKSKNELEKHYKERWSYINGFSIDKVTLQDNKDDIVFSEHLELVIPNYLLEVGNDLLLCPNVFNQSQYIPSRIRDRRQMLHIKEGFEDVDSFDITIPEGYSVDSLPKNETVTNKFGSYSIQFEKLAENRIKYNRKLTIKKGTFPASEYENYRNFRRKISKLDTSKILLTPK